MVRVVLYDALGHQPEEKSPRGSHVLDAFDAEENRRHAFEGHLTWRVKEVPKLDPHGAIGELFVQPCRRGSGWKDRPSPPLFYAFSGADQARDVRPADRALSGKGTPLPTEALRLEPRRRTP